jgi:hypothetical protein
MLKNGLVFFKLKAIEDSDMAKKGELRIEFSKRSDLKWL